MSDFKREGEILRLSRELTLLGSVLQALVWEMHLLPGGIILKGTLA